MTAAVLVYRTSRDSGAECTCREVADPDAAESLAIAIAEYAGECRVYRVGRPPEVVQHSRAVPHGQMAREAERVISG